MCSHNCDDGVEQSAFNPREYLYTYYEKVDDENRDLLDFWDTLPVKHTDNILEVGCGPTIFTAIPLAWKANHMALSDAMPENLKEIDLWRTYHPLAFNWKPTIEHYFTSSIHARDLQHFSNIKTFENALHARITTFPFDLHKDTLENNYDIIVTSFCLAEACDCWEDFTIELHGLVRHLNPHGTFGLATAVNSSKYTIGDTTIPMASINTNRLSALFLSHFDEVHMKLIPIDMDRGYTKIAGIWGKNN